MNRRKIYAAVISFLTLVVLANVVNAQSKDIDNPTRLTSNEISGLINSNSIGNVYYYSFTANQGEVSIKLTVEPGKQVNYGEFSTNSVSFRLFNPEGRVLLDNGVTASEQTGSSSYIAKTKITQRQIMILSVDIPRNDILRNNAVGGKYRIQIGGAIELPQNILTTGDPLMDKVISSPSPIKGCLPEVGATIGTMIFSKCFPKQGALIIEMKDGSKKVIDLSEAETIKVVP